MCIRHVYIQRKERNRDRNVYFSLGLSLGIKSMDREGQEYSIHLSSHFLQQICQAWFLCSALPVNLAQLLFKAALKNHRHTSDTEDCLLSCSWLLESCVGPFKWLQIHGLTLEMLALPRKGEWEPKKRLRKGSQGLGGLGKRNLLCIIFLWVEVRWQTWRVTGLTWVGNLVVWQADMELSTWEEHNWVKFKRHRSQRYWGNYWGTKRGKVWKVLCQEVTTFPQFR